MDCICYCTVCRQEQLQEYERERQLLLGESMNAGQEIEALSREYAKLLGHQNQKQKIHHIRKLKDDNLKLKDVCACAVYY